MCCCVVHAGDLLGTELFCACARTHKQPVGCAAGDLLLRNKFMIVFLCQP